MATRSHKRCVYFLEDSYSILQLMVNPVSDCTGSTAWFTDDIIKDIMDALRKDIHQSYKQYRAGERGKTECTFLSLPTISVAYSFKPNRNPSNSILLAVDNNRYRSHTMLPLKLDITICRRNIPSSTKQQAVACNDSPMTSEYFEGNSAGSMSGADKQKSALQAIMLKRETATDEKKKKKYLNTKKKADIKTDQLQQFQLDPANISLERNSIAKGDESVDSVTVDIDMGSKWKISNELSHGRTACPPEHRGRTACPLGHHGRTACPLGHNSQFCQDQYDSEGFLYASNEVNICPSETVTKDVWNKDDDENTAINGQGSSSPMMDTGCDDYGFEGSFQEPYFSNEAEDLDVCSANGNWDHGNIVGEPHYPNIKKRSVISTASKWLDVSIANLGTDEAVDEEKDLILPDIEIKSNRKRLHTERGRKTQEERVIQRKASHKEQTPKSSLDKTFMAKKMKKFRSVNVAQSQGQANVKESDLDIIPSKTSQAIQNPNSKPRSSLFCCKQFDRKKQNLENYYKSKKSTKKTSEGNLTLKRVGIPNCDTDKEKQSVTLAKSAISLKSSDSCAILDGEARNEEEYRLTEHRPKKANLKTDVDMSWVPSLDQTQLDTYLNKSMEYLKRIFHGKIECARHESYKKGGCSRNNLSYQVHLGVFSDDQVDVIMQCLMTNFCRHHHKYLDYVTKVLLPEAAIKIIMDAKGMSHKDAEDMLHMSDVGAV